MKLEVRVGRAPSLRSSASSALTSDTTSSLGEGAVLDGLVVSDAIFLPWSIHAQLEAAQGEGASSGESEMVVLASLVSETAQWLREKSVSLTSLHLSFELTSSLAD